MIFSLIFGYNIVYRLLLSKISKIIKNKEIKVLCTCNFGIWEEEIFGRKDQEFKMKWDPI